MVSQNIAEIIKNHVVLEVEGIDRMYLNGYVPGLQTEGGFVHFVASTFGFPHCLDGGDLAVYPRRLSMPSRCLPRSSKLIWSPLIKNNARTS